MALNIKEICRLCAKKEEFLKDLMDESNKDVFNLIRDLAHINVNKNDGLPSQVCTTCVEKLVSFQLFILECYKVQDFLKKIVVENLNKFHVEIHVKQEVKYEEDTPDEVMGAVLRDSHDKLTATESNGDDNFIESFDYKYDEQFDISSDHHNDDDGIHSEEQLKVSEELDDDLVLATLKSAKDKCNKDRKKIAPAYMSLSEERKIKKYKIHDYVVLACNICSEKFKTWSNLKLHYLYNHETRAVAFCVCGYAIKSKSVLYKHVAEHREANHKVEISQPPKETYSRVSTNQTFIIFNCSICDKHCSNWYTLKKHCEVSHKTQPVVHCNCGMTLKSKSAMYKHIQDHKNPNALCCDKCPRITKSLSALTKHKMRHEQKYNCSSCDKQFLSKENLKSHLKSHIPIEERKTNTCDYCDLKFTTRSSLMTHKRVVHEKIKRFVCDLCGYACGTNGELRQHRAIHSDDKPFVCGKCSKQFKTYSNLKTHIDTHDETSYVCFVCSRILNSRRTLRKHLIVHQDKCGYICSYCNKAFKRRQTLKVHMHTHTGDKPLSCKWCDEKFSYASTLRSHRLRCHPEKVQQTRENSMPNSRENPVMNVNQQQQTNPVPEVHPLAHDIAYSLISMSRTTPCDGAT